MKYEVEIKVKVIGTFGDTLRSARETWTFGDNPRWILAGEAYCVEETAAQLSEKIRDELLGANKDNLNDHSGIPQKA